MDKLFHKTTWSEVKAGDTVLIVDGAERIGEVEVKEAKLRRTEDRESMVSISFTAGYAKYVLSFDPEASAYVESRL